MRLKDVMQTPVLTIEADAPLSRARALMSLSGIKWLPVLQARLVVGLVTAQTMAQAMRTMALNLPPHEYTARLNRMPVKEIMQRHVIALSPETPAVHAAQMVWEGRAECFLVTQAYELMGIVTTTELLDTFITLLEEQRPAQYTHILVPTDFGSTAEHALHKALRLACQQRSTLTLLHVLPCPSSMLALDVDHVSAEAVVQVLEDCQADALARLAGLVPRGTACPVDYHVARGETVRVIVRVARHRQVDLIAMGHPSHRGWRRLFARHISREVVRQAPCPVLLVEEPARYELVNTSRH